LTAGVAPNDKPAAIHLGRVTGQRQLRVFPAKRKSALA
jgi:hypothetical protein